MASKLPAQERETILAIVAEHPGGVGISELDAALAQRLPQPIHRRTLQRRLDLLMAEAQIVASGASIARVYKSVLAPMDAARAAAAELYVPVSVEGGLIRDHVRQALMHRRPVGYQRQFLENYEPGVSWYLPEATRVQLHEMGRTAADERPAGTYARDILNRLLVDLSWASSRLRAIAASSGGGLRHGVPSPGHAPDAGGLFSLVAGQGRRYS